MNTATLCFFLAAMFGNHIGLAQSYQILPDSCTHCFFTSSDGGSGFNYEYYSVNPNADTTISGTLYTAEASGHRFRQVNNQLYILPMDSSVEYLVMDWDIPLGDTLFNLYDPYGDPGPVLYNARLTGIDSVILNSGTWHRFAKLEGIAYRNYQDNWQNYNWQFVWNERGLCHSLNTLWPGTPTSSIYGGMLFSFPINDFSVSLVYSAINTCSEDPVYDQPPHVHCTGCAVTWYNTVPKNESEIQLIFPNPASHWITFSVNSSEQFPAHYEFYDASGKYIDSGNLESSDKQIDISPLSPGTYHFRLISQLGVFTTPVVITD
jgi:hypothetical protein